MQEHKHQVDDLTDTMRVVLKSLEAKPLSRREIFAALGMSGDTRAFRRIIQPLLTSGFITMTLPDKLNSKLQRYRLTDIGREANRK
jgi:hypothetical protein